MLRTVLIACLALACGSMTPEERGIEVDRSIVKVYNQDKAMLQLEGMAEDFYGVRLSNEFESTKVWWATTPCPYTDDPAVIYENHCYYGRLWSCGEIYVALPRSGKTCGSALLHEFGHCLMMIIKGYGDANHSSDVWPLVAEAHGLACARETGALAFSEEWQQLSDRQIADCGFEE